MASGGVDMKENVALFGLSGDPAHKGHLAACEHVLELGYERAWWSIAPANPFKPARGRASYSHRHNLAALLLEEMADPRVQLHDFEVGLKVGLNEEIVRTFILLSMLVSVYGDTCHFTFVMGSDNWKEFHKWGRFEEILQLASILVCNRGDRLEDLLNCPAALALAGFQDNAIDGVVTPGCWRVLANTGHLASSTKIAAEIAAGGVPQDLTERQMDYIRKNQLYGCERN